MSINRFFSFLFFVIGLILSINLFRDLWRLYKAEERLTKAEEKLVELKKEKEGLEEKKEYYQSEAFLEEQIRNKLHMAKPEETILVLPEELSETVKEVGEVGEVGEEKANWEKWLALFK